MINEDKTLEEKACFINVKCLSASINNKNFSMNQIPNYLKQIIQLYESPGKFEWKFGVIHALLCSMIDFRNSSGFHLGPHAH